MDRVSRTDLYRIVNSQIESNLIYARTAQIFFQAWPLHEHNGGDYVILDYSLFSILMAEAGVGGVGGFTLGLVVKRIASLLIGAISFVLVAILAILGGLTKLGLPVATPQGAEGLFVGMLETAFRGLLSASATALPFNSSFSLGLCLGLFLGKPQSWT